MRKLVFSSFMLLAIAGIGAWWLQSRHQSTQGEKNSQVASRPDIRPETPQPISAPEGASPIGPPSVEEWFEIERTIIVGNSVVEEAERRVFLADAKQFRRNMDSLEAAMMTDPLALEAASNYRELLLDRLRVAGGQQALNLDRIACSGKLCYVQLSGNEVAWDDFSGSLSSAGVEDFPTNTRSFYAHTDARTGIIDRRVMFTTSPQIKSFRVRPPRSTTR